MPIINQGWLVQCDECGENLADFIYAPPSKKEAVSEARKTGWTVGKRVLCPDCKPKDGSDAT